MDITIQQKIDGYLEVCERVKPIAKDAAIVAAVIEQIGKDTRCERLMNGRSNGNGNGHLNGNGDKPATAKQIDFMKKLGVPVPVGVSKKQASRLIDEAQANAT